MAREVVFQTGTNLNTIVKMFADADKRGEYVWGLFKGKVLHSMMSSDQIYLAVTGLTKEQYMKKNGFNENYGETKLDRMKNFNKILDDFENSR